LEYGHLRGLDNPISKVILGTDSLWLDPIRRRLGLADSCHASRILDAAWEMGINAFDTAAIYPSEPALGCWLNRRKIRSQAVVITKCGHPQLVTGRPRLSFQQISHDIHRSLRRLQSDYIDLLLVHFDHEEIPAREVVDWLGEHRMRGNIRCFGLSNWRHKRVLEAHAYAGTRGDPTLSAVSGYFGLAEWIRPIWKGARTVGSDAQQGARDYYRRHGIAVLAWSPLSRGYLSGTVREPQGWRGRRRVERMKRYFDSAENRERIDRARSLAGDLGVSSEQVALAYLLRQPLNVFPIVGCGSESHLRQDAAAVEVKLTERDLQWLDLKSAAR